MSVTISDKDNGYARVLQTVREFSRGATVRVGVTDAPHEDSNGLSVADIGAIHEFGLGVPQRSFLRAWVDDNRRSILGKLRGLVAGAIYGVLGRRESLESFGRYAVRGVQKKIAGDIPPPLQEKTKRAKRRRGQPDTALIASKQLIEGIVYEVEE